MSDASDVARQAAADIEAWLRARKDTASVHNVEDDPEFQRIDVDLVWATHKRSYKIEVKTRRSGDWFRLRMSCARYAAHARSCYKK
jgi:hypothetical protein